MGVIQPCARPLSCAHACILNSQPPGCGGLDAELLPPGFAADLLDLGAAEFEDLDLGMFMQPYGESWVARGLCPRLSFSQSSATIHRVEDLDLGMSMQPYGACAVE